MEKNRVAGSNAETPQRSGQFLWTVSEKEVDQQFLAVEVRGSEIALRLRRQLREDSIQRQWLKEEMLLPPSMMMVCPTMPSEAGEHRKWTR